MRILWLYGPPAVGKSVTVWELLNARAALDPATGFVDIDQLGMSWVDEDDDPEGHGLKARALAAVARELAGSGVRTLVVSGVMGLELMEFYAEGSRRTNRSSCGSPPPTPSCDAGSRRRAAYAEAWAGVEEYARSLDAADLDHPAVESGPGTPAEVAARVLHLVGGLLDDGSATRDTVGVGVASETDARGRALLIGGTTAVGKSTIGWQAFLDTRKRGQRSGFVDLRQLGFVGAGGGAADHSLQARAASALWRVFRAQGAEILILNGPVNNAEELLTYRSALEGTPLTAIRLTASRPALVDPSASQDGRGDGATSRRLTAWPTNGRSRRDRGRCVPTAGRHQRRRPVPDARHDHARSRGVRQPRSLGPLSLRAG